MNIKVLSDEKNVFFRRREVSAELGYEGVTPSRMNVKRALADKLGAKEELVIVKRLKPGFGNASALVQANIYDDEKSLDELETKYFVRKNTPGQKKKETGAEGEAKPEEKQEKKEEKQKQKPEEQEKSGQDEQEDKKESKQEEDKKGQEDKREDKQEEKEKNEKQEPEDKREKKKE